MSCSLFYLLHLIKQYFIGLTSWTYQDKSNVSPSRPLEKAKLDLRCLTCPAIQKQSPRRRKRTCRRWRRWQRTATRARWGSPWGWAPRTGTSMLHCSPPQWSARSAKISWSKWLEEWEKSSTNWVKRKVRLERGVADRAFVELKISFCKHGVYKMGCLKAGG